MIFQSAMTASLAEAVFRSARVGVTKTVTNTSVTLPIKGGPVILASGTASDDGTYIGPALTKTSVVNNLFIGIAVDYPELRTNTAGRWAGESQGLVQCYGYNSDARVEISSDGNITGGGLYLLPNVNQFNTCDGNVVTATAATATAAHGLVPALGGLVVLIQDVASSSAASVGAANVFIRAM